MPQRQFSRQSVAIAARETPRQDSKEEKKAKLKTKTCSGVFKGMGLREGRRARAMFVTSSSEKYGTRDMPGTEEEWHVLWHHQQDKRR